MSDQSEIPTADAVEAFVASLRQRSVPVNTSKSYAHDLQLFVQFAPTDLPAVSAKTIQEFLASFSHLSDATRRRRYSTLCAFYHWLIRHGVIETNPMERLDPIEQVEREPRPLPPETVTKILQAIPVSNLRDRALFTLLYETGIRVGEALGLLATEVDLSTDDEKIRVFGKGQRERTVMLTAAPESIRLLRRHLKRSRITSGSVFRGDPRYGGSALPLEYSVVDYAWQKYCKAAGVEATIHQLGDSRASQLLQAGVPISQQNVSSWGIATSGVRCSMRRSIKPRSKRTCSSMNGAKEGRGKRMWRERTTRAWEAENEEVRGLFTLTRDDLYFLHPVRADAQRLYRA